MDEKNEIRVEGGILKKYQDVIIPAAIVVFVLLLSIILFLVFRDSAKDVASDDNKIEAVTEKGIVKDEKYQGLTFTNATLVKENDIYTLSVDVKNTSKEVSKIMAVNIPINDKEGNEIITLLGYIGKELQPDETTTIVASTSTDLSKAYTKEIVEKEAEPANTDTP